AMSAANANLQTVLIGMIMLAAVIVDVIRRRGKLYREQGAEQIAAIGGLRKWLRVPELGILSVLVGLTLIFGAFKPVFLEPATFATLLRAGAYMTIISVGWTFLLVAGEIDLSVGAAAGFSAAVCALLMSMYGWPILPSVLAGLLVGAVVGLTNGLVSVKIGVPAFITTLAMAFILQGFSLLVTKGYPVYPLPDAFNAFGSANPGGVSWAFWIAVALVILGSLTLRRTIWGARASATGGNKLAARVAGINTDRVKIVCFMLVGILSALAGILAMARANRGEVTLGANWNLDVIAGVALGGGSLSGGLGTVIGAFIGVVTMQILRAGVVMTGLNYFWQSVAVGVVMLLAVAVDSMGKRRRA
ncbi:MAG: ABC transporter permease, partial [Anaerolineales bacterium]|nr:ABC transporter permease [Anaerolineales bacterium]